MRSFGSDSEAADRQRARAWNVQRHGARAAWGAQAPGSLDYRRVTLFLYVLRLLCAAVVISAGGLFLIAIPGIVVSAVHRLGGVNISDLMGFLPIVLTGLVPYLLPIGFLLALVATYGRLAADNEWTAINMAGIHPLRMVWPAVVVALVLGGASHWLSTEVSPSISLKEREYARDILLNSFRDMSPGRTEISIFKDFYLSAQSRDPDSNIFRDVTIHVPAQARSKQTANATAGDFAGRTILADVAEFSFPGDSIRVDLTRPRSADEGSDLQVEQSWLEVDVDELLQIKPKNRREWRYQTSGKLRRMLLAGEVPEEQVRAATYEFHRRNAMTSTYLMFILLGVPTGLLLRRGTQLGALAAAVGYAMTYYLLSIRLGKALTGWGVVPPAVGAWATPALGSVAGLWLCWRAFRR